MNPYNFLIVKNVSVDNAIGLIMQIAKADIVLINPRSLPVCALPHC